MPVSLSELLARPLPRYEEPEEEPRDGALEGYRRYRAATPRQSDAGFFSDTGNLSLAGLAQLAQGAGYLTGLEGLESYGRETAQSRLERLSPEMQQALANEFVTHDDEAGYGIGPALTETPLRSIYGALVQSIPATAAGMGVGGGIAMSLGALGRAAATRGIAGGATLARPMVSGAAGFGAGEGVVGGSLVGSDVKDFVRNAPQEMLDQSPRFQEYVNQGMTVTEARDAVADDLSSSAFWKAGAITALLGAPMGAVFGRWIGGQAPETVLRGIGMGAAGEAAQEAGQSAGEDYFAGTAMAEIDPSQAPTLASMANAAVGGALAGGVMGGGLGGVSSYLQRSRAARQRSEKTDELLESGGVKRKAVIDNAIIESAADNAVAAKQEAARQEEQQQREAEAQQKWQIAYDKALDKLRVRDLTRMGIGNLQNKVANLTEKESRQEITPQEAARLEVYRAELGRRPKPETTDVSEQIEGTQEVPEKQAGVRVRGEQAPPDEEVTEVPDDQEIRQGVQRQEQEGEEPGRPVQVEGAGEETPTPSGILQAPEEVDRGAGIARTEGEGGVPGRTDTGVAGPPVEPTDATGATGGTDDTGVDKGGGGGAETADGALTWATQEDLPALREEQQRIVRAMASASPERATQLAERLTEVNRALKDPEVARRHRPSPSAEPDDLRQAASGKRYLNQNPLPDGRVALEVEREDGSYRTIAVVDEAPDTERTNEIMHRALDDSGYVTPPLRDMDAVDLELARKRKSLEGRDREAIQRAYYNAKDKSRGEPTPEQVHQELQPLLRREFKTRKQADRFVAGVNRQKIGSGLTFRVFEDDGKWVSELSAETADEETQGQTAPAPPATDLAERYNVTPQPTEDKARSYGRGRYGKEPFTVIERDGRFYAVPEGAQPVATETDGGTGPETRAADAQGAKSEAVTPVAPADYKPRKPPAKSMGTAGKTNRDWFKANLRGREVWTNGHIMTLIPPDKVDQKPVQPDSRAALSKVRGPSDGDRVVPKYRRDDEFSPVGVFPPDPDRSVYPTGVASGLSESGFVAFDHPEHGRKLVAKHYFDHFAKNYPDARFFSTADAATIAVESNGELVGVISPMRMNDALDTFITENVPGRVPQTEATKAEAAPAAKAEPQAVAPKSAKAKPAKVEQAPEAEADQDLKSWKLKRNSQSTTGKVRNYRVTLTDPNGKQYNVTPAFPKEEQPSATEIKRAAFELVRRDTRNAKTDTRYSRANRDARSTVTAIREALGLTPAQERRIGLRIEQSPGEGIPPDVAGMFRDGGIVLFADNMSVDEARAYLLHEVTHKATREAMATPAFQQILEAVDKLRGKQGVFAEAERLLRRSEPALAEGFDKNPDGRERVMVDGRERSALLTYRERYLDEVLAYAAQTEKGRKSAPFKRLVALIRDYLRRMGLVRKYSENDLVQIAPIALRRLARGETMVRSYNGLSEPAYSFAGGRARTADKWQLGTAKMRLDAGADPETVRQETGWFKGVDGKWRFEIDDTDAGWKIPWDEIETSGLFEKGQRLDDALDHPKLFAAYPELRDVTFHKKGLLFDFFGSVQGWFDSDSNTLVVTPNVKDADAALSTALHEMQHWIQSREGFATGGNSDSVRLNNLSALNKLEREAKRVIDGLPSDDEIKAIRMRDFSEGFDLQWAKKQQTELLGKIAAVKERKPVLDELYKEHDDILEEIASIDRKISEIEERIEKQKKAIYREREAIKPDSEGSYEEYKAALDRRGELNKQYLAVPSAFEATKSLRDRKSSLKDKARSVNSEIANTGDTDIGYHLYRLIAGEMEARDVQGRKDMTAAERRATKPHTTEGIPDENLIIVDDPGAAQETQYSRAPQTDTKAFKDWFGASVVTVDGKPGGEPLVMYHGSPFRDLTVIQAMNYMKPGPPEPTPGRPIFFTKDKKYAAGYADRSGKNTGMVYPVYIKAERIAKVNETFDPQKHDAKFFINNKFDELAVYNPTQIKSTGNVGTFDPNNPDIRYSRTGPVDEQQSAARGTMSALGKQALSLPKATGRVIKDATASARPVLMNLMTRQMLVEGSADVSEEFHASARGYEHLARAMERRVTMQIHKVVPLAQDWAKLNSRWWWNKTNRDEAIRMADTMHSATRALTDPAEALPANATDEQQAEHARLKRVFDSLSERSRNIYRQVRDAYSTQRDDLYRAMMRRIANVDPRTTLPTDMGEFMDYIDRRMQTGDMKSRRAALGLLRQSYESGKIAVYFRLFRNGEYYLYATDPEGKPRFSLFKSQRLQREAMDDLIAQGYDRGTISAGKQIKNLSVDSGPGQVFMANILTKVEEANLDADAAKALKEELWQSYLHSLPDVSLRKAFIHRRGTAGFSEDALQAFASQMSHGARQIARLEAGHALSDQIVNLKTQARELGKQVQGDADRLVIANRAKDYAEALDSNLQWMMNPTTARWASRLTGLGFVWYLGATPGAGIVNGTQVGVVSFPALGARFGPVAASRELGRAYKEYGKITAWRMQSWYTDAESPQRKAFDRTETGRMLKILEESGVLDRTQMSSLIGMEDTPGAEFKLGAQGTMQAIGFMYHEAERLNREVTGIAAYRLAREKMSPMRAVEFAYDMTQHTQFSYENSNRSAWMRNNSMRVITLFMQYSTNIAWRMARDATVWANRNKSKEERRIARNELAGILGMTMFFAGAMGLPFAGSMVWLLQTANDLLSDDDDEEWSAELAVRQTLRDLGAGTSIFEKGAINTLTPFDLSGRTSLSYLFFRPPDRDLDAQNTVQYYLEQGAGPVFGAGLNVARGVDLMTQGQVLRGAELMVPKFIRDVLRSGRYLSEGALSLRGDPIKSDFTATELIGQAIGLSPANLVERYEQRSELKNLEQKVLNRRQSLMNGYWLAWRNGDRDLLRDILGRIRSFNRAHPQLPISASTIRRSMRARVRAGNDAIDGLSYNRSLQTWLLDRAYLD